MPWKLYKKTTATFFKHVLSSIKYVLLLPVLINVFILKGLKYSHWTKNSEKLLCVNVMATEFLAMEQKVRAKNNCVDLEIPTVISY